MTRFALLGGLFLALPLSAGAEDKKEVPKDLVPFQGTWKVAKAELAGKAAEGIKLQFTFTNTTADFVEGADTKGTGSIAIDSKKSPAEIDLFSDKGQKSPGIYKFEKDGETEKLIICFVKNGDKRPKDFKSTDLPEAVLLTLEKVKK